MAALSIFGLGVMGIIIYGIFYKLMLTQGVLLAGLGSLALLVLLGCGLLSVILFARANELKGASTKRQIKEPSPKNTDTKELLSEAHPEPVFSVAERTTGLLPVERDRKSGGS